MLFHELLNQTLSANRRGDNVDLAFELAQGCLPQCARETQVAITLTNVGAVEVRTKVVLIHPANETDDTSACPSDDGLFGWLIQTHRTHPLSNAQRKLLGFDNKTNFRPLLEY